MFNAFLKNSKTFVCFRDTQGKLVAITDFKYIFPKNKSNDFIGTQHSDYLTGQWVKVLDEYWKKVIESAESIEFELCQEHDGEKYNVRSTIFPVFDNESKVVGAGRIIHSFKKAEHN